ncbi:acyltransferase 3 [Desulfovibrio sp. X2]|uniref:acyltransferase family protein n=1 Tax=Desulfovibrio sp. X2 TaxID=941449 RepID=UPI000358DE41|nr:acyltransferase [Desulfovibrio sp. X2]EPR43668.1 acyltransferase 3 [Desulfovibrio sp. X2]
MGLLRMFLALSVFFSHEGYSGVTLLTGEAAVQAFFVVSGFYMALILREKYAGAPLSLFYSNRFLRLAPAYWAVLLLSFAALVLFDAAPFVGRAELARTLHGPAGPVVLWNNLGVVGDELLFLFRLDPDTGRLAWTAGRDGFTGAYVYLLLPQAWSLSVEALFYLAAPFLVRKSPRALAALAACSLALRFALLHATPGSDLLARKIFPAELWLFLLGILAYGLYSASRNRPRGQALAPALFWLLLAGGTYLSGLPLSLRTPLCAGFLALAVPCLFRLTRQSRLDRFLGDLSYPFYIVHFLILSLLDHFADPPATAAALLLTLGAALALHFCLDRPVDRWRQRRLGRPGDGNGGRKAPAAAAVAAAPAG